MSARYVNIDPDEIIPKRPDVAVNWTPEMVELASIASDNCDDEAAVIKQDLLNKRISSLNEDKFVKIDDPISAPFSPCNKHVLTKLEEQADDSPKDEQIYHKYRKGKKDESVCADCYIEAVEDKVLSQIESRASAMLKENQSLFKMLTKLMVDLDDMQVSESSRLQAKKKSIYKLINVAESILEEKETLNTRLADLVKSQKLS